MADFHAYSHPCAMTTPRIAFALAVIATLALAFTTPALDRRADARRR